MSTHHLTRREMLKALGVTGAGLITGCNLLETKGASHYGQWWRGNLHMHTYWSDGTCFPEIAVDTYRNKLGYHFLALSDHNRLSMDEGMWRQVVEKAGKWPPDITQEYLDHYLKSSFGQQAQTRTSADGKAEVRLRPFNETKRMFDEPGRFLLMPGVEITQDITDLGNVNVHMNYVNLPEVIPMVKDKPLVHKFTNISASELIAQNAREVAALAARLRRPTMLMLNHPQWRYLDVQPGNLIDNPDVRFFEVCNGGSAFPPLKENQVDSNDYFWDTVNAFRVLKGAPLIYGTGSDDTHSYFDIGTRKAGRVGVDYIVVRSASLTPDALLASMYAGDFYASTGVTLDDVAFNPVRRSLAVKAKPEPNTSYTISFITTKRDFSQSVSRVAVPAVRGHGKRDVAVYSRDIGITVKQVEGNSASYTMAPDDLYVRARIDSTMPSAYKGHFHPAVKVAWTQPFTTA